MSGPDHKGWLNEDVIRVVSRVQIKRQGTAGAERHDDAKSAEARVKIDD